MSALFGRRILVIEDESLVAMLIEDVLTEHGATMIGPATTLAQALRLVEAENFEAAILDVNLNGERTFPVADALIKRKIPFLFSTGYGSSGVDAAYAGRKILQKPFQESDLATALAQLL